MSGLDPLLRMVFFLCFVSAVSNKLHYTGDKPVIGTSRSYDNAAITKTIEPLHARPPRTSAMFVSQTSIGRGS